jgi:hypothetical protein
MQYILTKHASLQIKRRKIPKAKVDDVINNPGQIVEDADFYIYQSIIEENQNNKYLLRIFVKRNEKPLKIITAYKTSKIKKYYEG